MQGGKGRESLASLCIVLQDLSWVQLGSGLFVLVLVLNEMVLVLEGKYWDLVEYLELNTWGPAS
jgi:hypothetical protein